MIEARRFRRVGEIAGKRATRDIAEEVDFVLLNIFMAFTIRLGFFLTEGKIVQSGLEQKVKKAEGDAIGLGAGRSRRGGRPSVRDETGATRLTRVRGNDFRPEEATPGQPRFRRSDDPERHRRRTC